MLPLLQVPIPTFINVEIVVVFVLRLSFVTGLNLCNIGMRIAFAGGMCEATLAMTYPNASAEDQVWPLNLG